MDLQHGISYYPNMTMHTNYWYISTENGDTALHNDFGPALTVYTNDGKVWYEEWYENGIRHRMNGAAHIEYNEEGKQTRRLYYLKGKGSPCLKSWLVENGLYEVPLNKWTSGNMAAFVMAFW